MIRINPKDSVLWGIHAGETGDADELFLRRGRVALGWHEMGDLAELPPHREAFKAKVGSIYPGKKAGSIANNAGQLFRFTHEMKLGDILIYTSKADRQIHLGIVSGQYKYDPGLSAGYPHTRPAEWKTTVPRSRFTQGALYEIGSAISLFQVKRYAQEFRAALDGKVDPHPISEDETVAEVAKDVADSTHDFVIKQLAQELKGHPFSWFIGHLLNTMGYRTRISPEGADGGVDIVAHKDELGFEPPIIKVQVKSTDGSVGDPVVSALYGKVGQGEFGLLVTLGVFTSQARAFAKSKTNLRLIDGSDLVELIFQHYEQFDSRYKTILPLRRVYVPYRTSDDDE